MKTGFRHTLWSLGVIAAFIAGIGTGVYYRNEITVIGRSLFPGSTGNVAGIQEPLPSLRADQSFIMLPAFAQSLPLVYSDTLEEERIQEYLKEGAVVLPLGKSFGEPGNVVVTAHSSGTEAFGPYRFAFAELSELQEGQEYTVTTTTAVYTYRVYGKEVVWPHEVDKLPNDDRSTVTLVTCWPVWTNFKRLLVHSELVKTEYKI